MKVRAGQKCRRRDGNFLSKLVVNTVNTDKQTNKGERLPPSKKKINIIDNSLTLLAHRSTV